MESVEAARALKSSLRWELSTKLSQPVFFDEFPGRISSGEGNVVAGEDFPVEDFLNFSNEEFELGSVPEVVEAEDDEDEEEEEEKDSLSVSSSQEAADDDNNSNTTGVSAAADDSASLLDAGLSVPGDCLSELEWVSQFVEDSPLDFSLLFPVYQTTKNHTPTANHSEPEQRPINAAGRSLFPSPIPARPRTKRLRTSRVWSLGSPLSESSSTSSSSSSPPGFSLTPCLIFSNTVQNLDLFPSTSEPPSKKQKKKPSFQTGGSTQFQRRCSHCQVQKTPQWRTGPLGAKTLCNACGVRYKSGRLFPEYRPACSPTFSVEVHSNSHRKVLEMRKRKEISGPESGLTQMVPSF